ncbi:transcriptional regulator [Candidatus Roizmanbacteria bacterium CG_4_9_14_0_2_um_filter_39_13]|uniref:Transcriptional regulator n=2 Tax=Candidatus Roizmaniibacteriota TaxID=1752723 RepID=A0A2M8EX11_9BACT|nr:MAG: transcriptional regulator [Candidatus Roizmanbacteria bacterium CG_4_10_14_0_2_um_filter_39_12]PJC30408.1 MAG: transcriptional regulator [Candidatus Roizmanbacteria bacterium CG_4_9_14_0_2_um_filter_39_13]PJE62133.1 MAG: transcriptional regulator [Candidatus Roizmanbacteria bacterium CG10_big_fil_rev_8_21_14_0_10_39_12]
MKGQVLSRVLEQRTKSNITQQDLADAIGVTRQTIFAIEKGRYTPSVALALKLARYFQVTVEELFTILID